MSDLTPFEQDWKDRYMKNLAALATLEKLAAAGKLTREAVDGWAAERKEKYGI